MLKTKKRFHLTVMLIGNNCKRNFQIRKFRHWYQIRSIETQKEFGVDYRDLRAEPQKWRAWRKWQRERRWFRRRQPTSSLLCCHSSELLRRSGDDSYKITIIWQTLCLWFLKIINKNKNKNKALFSLH